MQSALAIVHGFTGLLLLWQSIKYFPWFLDLGLVGQVVLQWPGKGVWMTWVCGIFFLSKPTGG